MRWRVVRHFRVGDPSYLGVTVERLTIERDGGAGWVTVRPESGSIERMRASEAAKLLSKREATRRGAVLALSGKNR